MTSTKVWKAVVAIAALSSGVVVAARYPGDQAPTPGRPEALPVVVRELVVPTMQSHRIELGRILRATVMLDRDDLQVVASALAEAPTIADPLSNNGDELNAQIPTRFFQAQDALQKAAANLADLSTRGTDAEVTAAFGVVVTRCVECHEAFRRTTDLP